MSEVAPAAPGPAPRPGAALVCSRLVLIVALVLLAASFFLISPAPGRTYPGAIPWRENSALEQLTHLMSLYGVVAAWRGLEVKDLALHLATVAGLVLLGVRMLVVRPRGGGSRNVAVRYAQILLAGWVALSLFSSVWSGDPDMSRGQALIYAFELGWAVTLAALLRREHLPALLGGLAVIATLGAVLCIWYFYERNPQHRPGFPLGNPITVSVAILPGLLVCVATVAGNAWRLARRERISSGSAALAAGALVALFPMAWCLWLAWSRGALLALAVALGVMALFQIERRVRWALGIVLAVALVAGGALWFSSSHLDLTMARGATVRFRLYAWRYAAELWKTRPVAGHGAGAYPRLAGTLATGDRALDPAAFPGEIPEHAHNELFEVLTEIGLVGGVTFVGGFVATLFAATVLLRSAPPGPRRLLLLALVGGVAAILADSVASPALRLPGVAAIFYTLLGALWAAARSEHEAESGADTPAQPTARAHGPSAAAIGASVACFLAAAGAGWVTVRNWDGVRHELDAMQAVQAGDFGTAGAEFERADGLLLDPVRRIEARRLGLACSGELAARAAAGWLGQPTAARSVEGWQEAAEMAAGTYGEALHVQEVIPALLYTDATAARAAELLEQLHYAIGKPLVALDWKERADRAWLRQRRRTPYDFETLLALMHYPHSIQEYVVLLRDALRSGAAQGQWLAALRQVSAMPGFERTLQEFVATARPITPQTATDALIISMAPETERLAAAWEAERGDYATAARHAARAARLCEPLKPRFPELRSQSLQEQADYIFRESLDNLPEAMGLLEQAIDELPVIQRQKYEQMVRPYRFRMVLMRLAAGNVDAGLAELRDIVGPSAEDPHQAELILKQLLGEAEDSGLPEGHVQVIRQHLCPRFPTFCGQEQASE